MIFRGALIVYIFKRASQFIKDEGIKLMFHPRSLHSPKSFSIALLLLIMAASSFAANGQTQRSPSDVVREFYKAMREHRYREAFALTIYKSAVEGLTDEEMEVLRPGFEEKSAQIPATVEVVSEQVYAHRAGLPRTIAP